MKRGILVVLVLGLLVASLACNFVSGDKESTPEVVQSTPEVVQSTGGGQGFTITVDNMSSDDVCYVLISSSNEDSWGEDWLGENDIITAGTAMAFDIADQGAHDVMLLNCDEATLATAWEVSKDATVTVGGAGLVTFEVRNESSEEICYAYFSPSSSDSWGEDWLGAKETLVPQSGLRYFYLEPGIYDLLVQDCDGEDLLQKTEVDLSGSTTWTISD